MTMNNFDKTIATCRACLENNNKMKSIFESENIMNKQIRLCTVLNYCTNLDVYEGDGLPSQICYKCIYEVVKAFIFKQQFIRANTILREKLATMIVDSSERSKNLYNFEHVIINHDQDNKCEKKVKDKPSDLNVYEISFITSSSSENNEHSLSQLDYDENNDLSSSETEDDQNRISETEKPKTTLNHKFKEDLNEMKTINLEKKTLRSYLKMKRTNKIKSQPVFTCEVCGKALSSSGSLKTHLLIHVQKTPFECNKCGEKFKTNNAYEDHVVTHNPNNPYKCNECGRGFRNAEVLEEHKTRAHKCEKPFLCGVCGKGLTQKVALKKHMMIHTGEKPYKCETCGKCFRYKSVYVIHRRYHTDERPYSCVECNLKFREKTHLRRHLLIHTGAKPFECEYCGRCFNRRTNLNGHRKIHTGERKHVCPICGKGFIQNNCMRAHMVSHEKTKEAEIQYTTESSALPHNSHSQQSCI